ncbi:putative prophage phiRv2 integrase [compost metagenome]
MAKGSIEKRGERTWRLTVDLGLNADGSRNRPRKTVTVEDDALLKTTKRLREYLEDELAVFKQKVLSGEYVVPSKMTFEKFYREEWKPKYAEVELGPTTLPSHCSKIENYVLPAIGHLQIEAITTMKLVTLFNDLRKPGVRIDKRTKKNTISSRTIQYIYDVTMSVFKRAVEWRVIEKNPLDGLKRPQISKADLKARRDRQNYFEEDEAEQVIHTLLSTKSVWRLYFLAAILGGFRRGELIALQIEDCDFEGNRLRIDENISRTVKGKAIITDTKNAASNDYVDMPTWFMDELAAHVRDLKKLKMKIRDKWEGGERNFVFHSGFGKPYYHTTPTQRWKDWCERNGFRDVSLHGLRHTNATYLLGSGATIKEIQHRLRHSTSQVTSDTYAHVTKKLSKRTISQLDKFDPNVRPQSVPNAKKDAN